MRFIGRMSQSQLLHVPSTTAHESQRYKVGMFYLQGEDYRSAMVTLFRVVYKIM